MSGGYWLFINKAPDGRCNLCGRAVSRKRIEMRISQRELADILFDKGLNVDKNAIQRIESGKRFVTDIELTYLARALGLSLFELLDTES